MYIENITPDAEDTEQLKDCEMQIDYWIDKAKALRKKIIEKHGHPKGSRATLQRANGKEISVRVAGVNYTTEGQAEYTFQWPYKNYEAFRLANVLHGDKIIWKSDSSC